MHVRYSFEPIDDLDSTIDAAGRKSIAWGRFGVKRSQIDLLQSIEELWATQRMRKRREKFPIFLLAFTALTVNTNLRLKAFPLRALKFIVWIVLVYEIFYFIFFMGCATQSASCNLKRHIKTSSSGGSRNLRNIELSKYINRRFIKPMAKKTFSVLLETT